MEVHGSGAPAVLGLDGFVLVGAVEEAGELVMIVETTADLVGCSGCGTRARSKGRPVVVVTDMAFGGRVARLVWRKRRWRCPDPDCPVGTWTEQTAVIGARSSLTERAKIDMCHRVGKDAASVAVVGREYGVSWDTVMRAVREKGLPLVDALIEAPPAALGVDETSFQAATVGRSTTYVTGLVDLDAGRMVDLIEGNNAPDLARWLDERPLDWLAQVDTVCVDPREPYRAGLAPALDHARLVVDPFHVVALGNRALDEVRRRVQRETLGHRGRKHDPLYRIRRTLTRGAERLDERGWQRLHAGLVAGDPADEILDAFLAKEHARDVYLTEDPTEAKLLLDKLLVFCAESHVPEVVTYGKTCARWHNEILAHHDTGASNGPTEALNLLVKKVKRCGHGFRSFTNYRIRVLLHCGVTWNTTPTASMRAHSPRKIA